MFSQLQSNKINCNSLSLIVNRLYKVLTCKKINVGVLCKHLALKHFVTKWNYEVIFVFFVCFPILLLSPLFGICLFNLSVFVIAMCPLHVPRGFHIICLTTLSTLRNLISLRPIQLHGTVGTLYIEDMCVAGSTTLGKLHPDVNAIAYHNLCPWMMNYNWYLLDSVAEHAAPASCRW